MINNQENKREENIMEKIVSLAKRRGFVFQGSEIYGGLSGTWDFGPLGTKLRENIKNLWKDRFINNREDIFLIESSILMNQKVWEASGHVAGFTDPLSECTKCQRRFRTDHLEDKSKCPECGAKMGEEKKFNMMFKTYVGPIESEEGRSYLRPETAQGMFVNFRNVGESMRAKLPFGIAQIGKAFRNEIAPKDFVFRVREFEQMEIEYFVDPRNQEKVNEIFNTLHTEQVNFLKDLGLEEGKIHKIEIAEGDRAHYSKRSVDTEFDFPFGQKELLGLAYRTDYDLKAHIEKSNQDLSYFDEPTKERFVPHCIEPTFGLDRLFLAVLSSAYKEDVLGDEPRAYLAFSPKVAPIKVAVFPLLKNKERLVEKATEVYKILKKEFKDVVLDDNGNIGKRYRRQDEIGTPFCVTIDFDTIEKDGSLTIRYRDTGEQKRLSLPELQDFLKKELN